MYYQITRELKNPFQMKVMVRPIANSTRGTNLKAQDKLDILGQTKTIQS